MSRSLCVVLLIVAVVFSPGRAAASAITWSLEGTVVSSTAAAISIGDHASMLITFESATVDVEPDPRCGLYSGAILGANAAFGSATFLYSGGPNGIEVSTGSFPGACGITNGLLPAYTYRMFPPGPALQLLAFFEGGQVLSDGLPLVPPFLFGGFDSGLRVILLNGGTAVAHITSATAVPEPTTLILLGTAGALGLWRRRAR